MKLILNILFLLEFMTFLISCNNKAIDINSENTLTDDRNDSSSELITQMDSRVMGFIENLKNREKLSSFFAESWILIYHEYNRGDGSTYGQIDNLKNGQIDSIIGIEVINDGDGWARDKKESKSYKFDFNLEQLVDDWDRFEVPNYEGQDENIIYVVGAGESDYLKLTYNSSNLIVKLEYGSEDPG